MAEAVKRRRYTSPRRSSQAQETRRLVLAAARERFLSAGYAGTRLADVAHDAGVAEPTVYAVFGSKRGLLMAVIGAAVGGDAAPVALLDRPEWQAVLAEPDPRRLLERFCRLNTASTARGWALIELARGAAAVEPELAALAEQGAASRWADYQRVVAALAQRGGLRAGLSREAATDLLWVQCASEFYRMLVIVRGWAVERYEQWLVETLVAVLLPDDARGAAGQH